MDYRGSLSYRLETKWPASRCPPPNARAAKRLSPERAAELADEIEMERICAAHSRRERAAMKRLGEAENLLRLPVSGAGAAQSIAALAALMARDFVGWPRTPARDAAEVVRAALALRRQGESGVAGPDPSQRLHALSRIYAFHVRTSHRPDVLFTLDFSGCAVELAVSCR